MKTSRYQQFAKKKNPKLQQNFAPNQHTYLMSVVAETVIYCLWRNKTMWRLLFGAKSIDCACCIVVYDVILYVVEYKVGMLHNNIASHFPSSFPQFPPHSIWDVATT